MRVYDDYSIQSRKKKPKFTKSAFSLLMLPTKIPLMFLIFLLLLFLFHFRLYQAFTFRYILFIYFFLSIIAFVHEQINVPHIGDWVTQTWGDCVSKLKYRYTISFQIQHAYCRNGMIGNMALNSLAFFFLYERIHFVFLKKFISNIQL